MIKRNVVVGLFSLLLVWNVTLTLWVWRQGVSIDSNENLIGDVAESTSKALTAITGFMVAQYGSGGELLGELLINPALR